MSFKKIQKISPFIIDNPDSGFIYLGQDDYGLWEKDEWGNVFYIQSGNTYITVITSSTSSGTSGSSGRDGSSGKDGTFGTSGSSGRGGLSGTSGSSGIGTNGTSGSSGVTGTSGSSGSSGKSGTSGSSGSSGSSGKDGIFYGSSGTSGMGGYGAATRVWIFSGNTLPLDGYFYGIGYGGYDLGLLYEIRLNKRDLNSTNLINWLMCWNTGILKIENVNDLSNSVIYELNASPYLIGNDVVISGLTALNTGGSLIENQQYYISFIPSKFLSGIGNNYELIWRDTGETSGYNSTSFLNWNKDFSRLVLSGSTIQIEDGYQLTNRVLTSIDDNGLARWQDPSGIGSNYPIIFVTDETEFVNAFTNYNLENGILSPKGCWIVFGKNIVLSSSHTLNHSGIIVDGMGHALTMNYPITVIGNSGALEVYRN
jgi:hypothetical protein